MAKSNIEQFRNLETGLVWSANPGTAAYERMKKGLASEEFERVQPEKRTRRVTETDEK